MQRKHSIQCVTWLTRLSLSLALPSLTIHFKFPFPCLRLPLPQSVTCMTKIFISAPLRMPTSALLLISFLHILHTTTIVFVQSNKQLCPQYVILFGIATNSVPVLPAKQYILFTFRRCQSSKVRGSWDQDLRIPSI